MSALRKEAIEFDYGQETLTYSRDKKRIKRNKRNSNVIESLKNTIVIAITFILGILIVYNYAVITDKQMELNTLNTEITNLNDDVDKYNIALESMKNTNSIEEMAKTYLGMNYPSRKQTVFIDFAYGSTTEEETEILAEENQNLLIGLFDKVVSFIQ